MKLTVPEQHLLILAGYRGTIRLAGEPVMVQDYRHGAPEMKSTVLDALESCERLALRIPEQTALVKAAIRAALKGGAIPVVIRSETAAIAADGCIDVPLEDPAIDIDLDLIPMPSNRTEDRGPFDLIGDIHACADELSDLLVLLGHARPADGGIELIAHAESRKLVFLGDIVDRGPKNMAALDIVQTCVEQFGAYCVLGNHDDKLRRYLRGNKISISPGMRGTIAELDAAGEGAQSRVLRFLETLETHYRLDGGRLVVAHAGLAEQHHGRHSEGARVFALYGDTTGRIDENGRIERNDWASSYAGRAVVVQGHDVYDEPRVVNNVYAIDTACVFGGTLTAMRYPEMEFTAVPARMTYYEKAGRK